MSNEKDLYIQRLESEIERNHRQWRKDQEGIIYWQNQCDQYKAILGNIYASMSELYEEMQPTN